jgi:hypothetical protein
LSTLVSAAGGVNRSNALSVNDGGAVPVESYVRGGTANETVTWTTVAAFVALRGTGRGVVETVPFELKA